MHTLHTAHRTLHTAHRTPHTAHPLTSLAPRPRVPIDAGADVGPDAGGPVEAGRPALGHTAVPPLPARVAVAASPPRCAGAVGAAPTVFGGPVHWKRKIRDLLCCSPGRVARCLLSKNAKICFKKEKWFDFTIESSIDFKKGQILNKF